MSKINNKNDIDFIKLNKILKIIEKNPNAAKVCLEKYLKNHPKDAWAHLLYSSVLISLNELETAKSTLTTARDLIYNSIYFKNDVDSFESARHSLIYNRLRILGYEKRAKEFLQLYRANKNQLPEVNLEDIFYFEHLLGNHIPLSFTCTYYGRQLIDYSDDRFIEHVKRHNSEEYKDRRNPNYAYFDQDFPYEKVVAEVKKNIPSSSKKNNKFYTNVYTFKFSNCGHLGDEACDYFRVVTYNDTDQIIKMNPILNIEDIEYIDLNHLKENSNAKQKTMIDRFNKRYGIN